jgi:hypothetical protein
VSGWADHDVRSRAMPAPTGLRSIASRLGSGGDNRRANAICLEDRAGQGRQNRESRATSAAKSS